MKDTSFGSRYLTRRGFLITGAMVGSASCILAAEPSCSLSAEQEEGPYYIDDETLRRDITEGRPGVPLQVGIRLVNAKTCEPLRNAAIDIWHCDAMGVYSGFTANSPDGDDRSGRPRPPGPPPPGAGFRPPRRQLDSTRFLRGVQVTNTQGAVEFSTLYPGWYSGRAIHIHLKVHIGGTAERRYSGGHVAHTGQLFFPEDITERVTRTEPYARRLSIHRTTQTEDNIFTSQHGDECMLGMEKLGKSDTEGFRSLVTLAVDPEATPAPVRGFGGRGPGGPPPRL